MVDLRTKPLTRGQIGQFVGSERGIRSYEDLQYDITGQNDALTTASFLVVNSEPPLGSERALTIGAGLSGTDGGPNGPYTLVNTAPDQIVSLTGAGTTIVSGAYPSFTITSNDAFVGTVISVDASGGTTGLSFTGGPITVAGTLTLGGTLSVANGGTGAVTLTGYVKGNGTSAFTASATIPGSDITGAALTKTDDTNVTLTLGGTPATALLAPTSLTLGWSGQLSVARGGTGVAASTGTAAVVLSTKPEFANTIGVGVAAAANGAGVSFPATQSPSTDPNTLDDYEEDIWTPTVTAGSGTITSYTSSGYYTKIGRQVFATATITITTNGTAATSIIATLPFDAAGTPAWVGSGREHVLTGNMLQVSVSSPGASMTIYTYNNGYPGGDAALIVATIAYFV